MPTEPKPKPIDLEIEQRERILALRNNLVDEILNCVDMAFVVGGNTAHLTALNALLFAFTGMSSASMLLVEMSAAMELDVESRD